MSYPDPCHQTTGFISQLLWDWLLMAHTHTLPQRSALGCRELPHRKCLGGHVLPVAGDWLMGDREPQHPGLRAGQSVTQLTLQSTSGTRPKLDLS